MGTKLYIKNQNPAINYSVLDFEGAQYVNLSGDVDVTGSKKITFNLYLDKESGYTGNPVALFYDGATGTDIAQILLYQDAIYITTSATPFVGMYYSLSGLGNKILSCEINKTTGAISSFIINGVTQTGTSGAQSLSLINIIGAVGGLFLLDATIWGIKIFSGATTLYSWDGYPSGNQNSAWVDSAGGIDGTVTGTSPQTRNIEGLSGGGSVGSMTNKLKLNNELLNKLNLSGII